MGASLPPIPAAAWAEGVRSVSPEPLSDDEVGRLRCHYEELRRWNPRLSLVGPGTAAQVVSRHYGEALAALPWLPRGASRVLVDIGSGAGFPGWVLAAVRPSWRVTLVESQQRKWAFLQAASRRAGLSVHCLDARVGPRLPEGFPPRVDRLTLRAVKLPPDVWEQLGPRMAEAAKILWWAGEDLDPPPGWRIEDRRTLPGADRRFLWVAATNDTT